MYPPLVAVAQRKDPCLATLLIVYDDAITVCTLQQNNLVKSLNNERDVGG